MLNPTSRPVKKNPLASGSLALNYCKPQIVRRAILLLSLLIPQLLCGMPSRASEAKPVSFRNVVMAVLSKSGCNAGACHGNANGKASFKLSLRGESADLDYSALFEDQFNRRVDLMDPEQSLLLLKAT